MAKFITFNGVTLVHPGGLTKVDATGMAQVGFGTSGVVGVIGEADYGQPYDPAGAALDGVAPTVYAFTDPDAMVETFKSGPLADAVDFLFNPSNDVRIPGGAQKVIALKSNIDTRSSAAAEDISTANVACTFTSAVYGKYANALSVTTAVNAINNSTMDVSIVDGNTDTTETFTQVGGAPLLDVQYAPSTPVQVGVEGVTSGGASGNETLVGVDAGVMASSQLGQYVQITEATAGQEFLVGQVRRIRILAGTTITVSGQWADATGAVGAILPAVDTKFIVIREAIGSFDVASYTAGTRVLVGSAAPGAAPTGPSFFVESGSADEGYYGDPTNGPCYVHIISGAGAGQIRRIASAAEIAAGGYALATGMVAATPALGYSIQLSTGFTTVPDATSKFVFINAVPLITSPTFTGSSMTGEGAVGVIGGTVSTTGKATSLTLSARPGFGEADGAGGWINPAGSAGALRTGGDWVFTLSSDLNVNALVNAINLGNVITGATKNAATTVGAWVARVGLGRDGALPSDRFDWTGRANGASGTSTGVDCLCDFATTNPSALGDFSATPNRYHRFVDNLATFIDIINSQSALVRAARATEVGPPGPAGTSYGDGVPAFQTYALSGGAYNATTAAGLNDCFDELIKHRHNTEVALFSETTANFSIEYVHSLLAINAKNGAGAYDNEVDCIASFRPTTTDVTPLITIKGYANTLNDRNVALTFQDIKRPGINGLVNQYPPHMLACAIAGMQAGSVIGTPLTFKLVRANQILCANTRVDTLDKTTSDDLLMNGCLFTEKVKGQGYRITRNLSTYVATDNLAYTDRHVNYELNFMAYDLRTFVVDKFIGVKATPGTVASVKSAVISKLDYYKNGIEIIVDSQDPATGESQNAYKNIKITISGDICTIRFEIFPAVGINYITFEIFAKLPTLSA